MDSDLCATFVQERRNIMYILYKKKKKEKIKTVTERERYDFDYMNASD